MKRRARPVSIEMYWRRRRVRLRVSLVVGLLLILALSWADHRGYLIDTRPEHDAAVRADLERYNGVVAEVVRVVDGDTLDVALPDGERDTTRVRLWGINAPELGHHDRETGAWLAQETYAQEAVGVCESLAMGRQVVLTVNPSRVRGKYGRVLAFVELPDGTILNERLLLAGAVRADGRWPHPQTERYSLLELQAKRDEAGLWGRGER